MRPINEFIESRIPAQNGIDREVVFTVVPVVCPSSKHRGQIQGIRTQRLNVIQVLRNALKVSAEEVLASRHTAPWFDISRIIARVTVAEAFREHLIEDRRLKPPRYRHRSVEPSPCSYCRIFHFITFRRHCLTPPEVNPLIRDRWKNRNIMMVGTVAINVPAISRCHDVP
ncbi:Hypothetical protein AAM4_1847 [Actinomyces succiniciruminis]|uniref:Uncharacterized protein n=1 Tax=Actinomyces succiniciruminis TaxID=1522002 RepID=A0A1L7RKP5_9ACTO|nr:Hypothetical protein AAM4_1847 [Actinomyces succiniciruminis]